MHTTHWLSCAIRMRAASRTRTGNVLLLYAASLKRLTALPISGRSDHTNIDQAFIDRLRGQFDDGEILDLTVCLAAFLGLGRVLNVLGIEETCLVDVYAPSERNAVS